MKLSTKIIIVILIFIVILTGVASFALYKSYFMPPEQLSAETQQVIDNFVALDQVPRPSDGEKQVSDYLVKWATDNEFPSVQDRNLNVIINKPAAYGYENTPLIILQTHMDMPVVTAPGATFDPQKDPISIVDDGAILSSDGKTNIGADGGIGIATAQQILTSDIKCGPLRMIVTVGRNTGFKGAQGIDAKYLNGAYLINLDSERSDTMILGSQGSLDMTAEKTVTPATPQKTKALTINMDGASDSVGELVGILSQFPDNGIEFELANIPGQSSLDSTPTSASMQIVVADSDVDKVVGLVDKISGGTTSVLASTMPALVVSDQDKQDIVKFANQIGSIPFNDIPTAYTGPKLPWNSLSLNSLKMDADGAAMSVSLKSLDMDIVNQMDDRVENLMAVCNIDLTAKTFGPAWPYNALSGLPGVIQKVYKSQNGTEMNLLGVNYEVECAEFVVKNPNLDMISIGADISSPNTVDETVDISSIDTLRKLTKGIIIQLMN